MRVFSIVLKSPLLVNRGILEFIQLQLIANCRYNLNLA